MHQAREKKIEIYSVQFRDVFWLCQGLMRNVTHADIMMGLKTDQSLITISAALNSNQRDTGYQMLITFFLSDANQVNQIRTTIKKFTEEYADDDNVNPVLMWEMIKLKIREHSIKLLEIEDENFKKRRRNRKSDKCTARIDRIQQQVRSRK